MRTFEEWMTEYSVSHQNKTNQLIHKVCVPFIMLSVLGILWSIPVPAIFLQVPYLNWASLFALGALGFYLSLNVAMFLGMIVQTFIMLSICAWVASLGLLLQASIVTFVVAWIMQFYGHKLEGKSPSFLTDLAFLLIGPLWVQRSLYQFLGIK